MFAVAEERRTTQTDDADQFHRHRRITAAERRVIR